MASSKGSRVTPEKPTSVWARKVKLDLKPLFVSLGKAAAHGASLKFDELGDDLAGVVESIGLDTPAGEVAHVLLQRALLSSLLELTNESASHFSVDCPRLESLTEGVASALSQVGVEISAEFFQRPGDQPFISEIANVYAQWLCDGGMAPVAAAAISKRLRSYFVFALSDEWRRNSQKYQALLDEIEGPFALAEIHERGWKTYFSHLGKRIDENVFDEPFSLAQIYIPLNAYVLEPDDTVSDQAFRAKPKRVVVDLEQELRSWLAKSNKVDAIRVLSGGPGSGKSSVTKVVCARLARDGLAKPIYIPLHLIDPTRDVASEVERFVRDEGLLGFNPLDPEKKEAHLLLVFDGLDELASQGRVAAQVTRDFVQAVEKMVERRNLGQCPVAVILSGRELVIQENETEFRRPRQIISLLPYFIQPDERREFVDSEKLLEVDLRDAWWQSYGALTGKDIEKIPEPLSRDEIGEITAQPLLNYLVALSFNRGRLNFTKRLNLNSVYADLVAAVYERGYEKTRTFRPISHLTAKDFVRVLEEIGLAAWHGSDGRSTSVKDIMIHCRESGLDTFLESFREGAEAGITKLLAAFFFRRNGDNAGDEAAFVFTHKSFGEYLTAARITRGLEKIVLGRKRRRLDPDDGFDVSVALVQWVSLTGAAPITEYIQKFLQREIAQRESAEIETWQEIVGELASHAIQRQMPVEKVGNFTFAAASRQDVNASTSLLIALNACSLACGRVAALNLLNRIAFGSFLRRTCPQRSGGGNPPIMSALSYLDLSGQCLDMADFYGANLAFSVFQGADIHFGNFEGAELNGADFSGAVLSWSRFSGPMKGTKFIEAHLTKAIFNECYLKEVDFFRAGLREAAFTLGEIEGCSFDEANLEGIEVVALNCVGRNTFERAIVLHDHAGFLAWFENARKDGTVVGDLKSAA
jgi:uncharacterized protein YjbI with pentapeptide repeats